MDLCDADFGVFLPTSFCPSQGHPALSKGTHFFEVVLCFAWTFSLHGVPELPHRERVWSGPIFAACSTASWIPKTGWRNRPEKKKLSIKFDCNCAILVRLKPVVGSPDHVLEMFSRVVPDIRHLNIECSSPLTQWWLSLWGIYFVAFAVADSYAPMWDGPCQLQTLFHGTMCDDNGTSPFCFLILGQMSKEYQQTHPMSGSCGHAFQIFQQTDTQGR